MICSFNFIFHNDFFQLIYSVMEYGGTHARQSDLFGTQDAVVKITKTFFKVRILMKF